MTTHNTREGVEEFIEKMKFQMTATIREICCDQPNDKYVAEGTQIARLEVQADIILEQAIRTLHQELQKAREEERRRIDGVVAKLAQFRCTDLAYMQGYTMACRDFLKATTDIDQSELDQPTI